jgi:hypothetical protein
MAGTMKRLAGPVLLTAAAANVYNPAATVVANLRQIHIANVTAGAITATAYIGATGGSAAGTELFKGHNIPANDERDWYWPAGLPMKTADFLTGLASAISSLVITVTGDENIIP